MVDTQACFFDTSPAVDSSPSLSPTEATLLVQQRETHTIAHTSCSHTHSVACKTSKLTRSCQYKKAHHSTKAPLIDTHTISVCAQPPIGVPRQGKTVPGGAAH